MKNFLSPYSTSPNESFRGKGMGVWGKGKTPFSKRGFSPSPILLILILLITIPAHAAGLAPVTKGITPHKAWNPWPAPDDIILPMPCNGQMVLRAVDVPSKGLLYDRKFYMGVGSGADTDRDMYERRFESHISAPFTAADLPRQWREILRKNGSPNDFYYFIGKYEVSVWQWRAVMEETCPAGPMTEADLRPKTGISWLEMQQFLYKYTDWLIKNNKSSLPVFADNDKDIGFLRLPTEQEWEFAARGGMRVPEEHRNQEDFYPLREYAAVSRSAEGEELKLGDFAVYQSAERTTRDPLPIGSRKPGPLLTYDMAGNAKELVQSMFHFSIAEQQGNATVRRLHGSSGGLVCKGGSFLSGEETVLPGWRAETPLFQESGRYAMRDMGLRVVLSGINTPASGSRLKRLEAENHKMSEEPLPGEAPKTAAAEASPPPPPPATPTPGVPELPTIKDGSVKVDASGNPLAELDKITAAATSPVVKENLSRYRAMLSDKLSAFDRQREDARFSALRAALFQAESLTNMAFRIRKTERDFYDFKKKGGLSKKDIEYGLSTLRELNDVLANATNNYKQDVESLSKVPPETLERHFAVLRKEYSGDDILSQHMRNNMKAMQKHLDLVRRKGITALGKDQVAKDVIPEIFRKPIGK